MIRVNKTEESDAQVVDFDVPSAAVSCRLAVRLMLLSPAVWVILRQDYTERSRSSLTRIAGRDYGRCHAIRTISKRHQILDLTQSRSSC